MNIENEYRLHEYLDLGELDGNNKVRLKRNYINGNICVEKQVSLSSKYIYDFLKEKKIRYVPEIYNCIATDTNLIVIEQYIEGRVLDDIIQEKSMGEMQIVNIILQLCDILSILHHSTPAIICRDLKAENIIVDKSGKCWLIDFDIARIFEKGKNRDTVLLGTAGYAAPEQFGFYQTDQRTDIYAMGVLMNYMATQKFPHEGKIKGKLNFIVDKCLAFEPEKRYQDIDDLKEDIISFFELEKVNEKETKLENVYHISGFRTDKLWKKIVAAFGCFLITYFSFTLEITSDSIDLSEWMIRIEQIIIWISQMIWMFLVCNCRNWSKRLPVLQKGIWRILFGIVVYVIVLFVAVFLCAIMEVTIFANVC